MLPSIGAVVVVVEHVPVLLRHVGDRVRQDQRQIVVPLDVLAAWDRAALLDRLGVEVVGGDGPLTVGDLVLIRLGVEPDDGARHDQRGDDSRQQDDHGTAAHGPPKDVRMMRRIVTPAADSRARE
jgi:hypothetical protein